MEKAKDTFFTVDLSDILRFNSDFAFNDLVESIDSSAIDASNAANLGIISSSCANVISSGL